MTRCMCQNFCTKGNRHLSTTLFPYYFFFVIFKKKQERHKKTKLSNCQSYNEYDFLYIIKMQMILNLEKP